MPGETIEGTPGDDLLQGGHGDDSVMGWDGNDTLGGGGGDDTVRGWNGNDNIRGGVGADILRGDKGHDRLHGGNGDDLMIAGAGRDVIGGGGGQDYLNVGDDDRTDRIVLNSADESNQRRGIDTVEEFDPGEDRVDLRRIDADGLTPENDAFTWIGDAGFSGVAGELRYHRGHLQGDVNGDGRADFDVFFFDITRPPAVTDADILL